MKAFRIALSTTIFAAVALVVISGCEYDVKQPLWYEDFTAPSSPTITTLDPDNVARAGVNTITIRGENFVAETGANLVYFGATTAEVFEASTTALKVYRPNLATDSCAVKVVSDGAFLVAKYPKAYKISAVVEEYGGFRDNLALSVAAVDQAENLYVVETGSRNIYKITPDGAKTTLGQASRAPTDAKIGPDGRLYMPGNNREIIAADLTSGAVSRWIQLPAGKVVRFGDFDANGYFYTGGTRTDLMIVAPDLSTKAAGVYPTTTTGANNDIIAVRVYNSSVYVATRSSATGPATIWRHALDASGNVGPQELVIDMSQTAFADRAIRSMAFATNGSMYLATDAPDPLLLVDPVTKNVEVLYKGILSSYCKQLCWGASTYLYMIRGDTILGEVWTMFRVDAGVAVGAP